MAAIEWQNVFNTDIPEVDSQHKKLVRMINRLDESISGGMVNDEIGRVLVALAEYTQYHFGEEERIMKQINYSHMVRHVAMHNELKSHIASFLIKLKKENNINVYELMSFLKDWLVNHIIKEDKKIGHEYHSHAGISSG